jgi:hypothetical protein
MLTDISLDADAVTVSDRKAVIISNLMLFIGKNLFKRKTWYKINFFFDRNIFLKKLF